MQHRRTAQGNVQSAPIKVTRKGTGNDIYQCVPHKDCKNLSELQSIPKKVHLKKT